ncbi:hypothetical protein [Serratia symbiotica]|nr:hypothetical protein [Serratia symbiotica]
MKDIIAIAARWRDANPEHVAGVVLVWQGKSTVGKIAYVTPVMNAPVR